MTKVSVIIPIHNEEKYLSQCIESVLSQTVKPYEVICVLDHCTDSSEEILKNYNVTVLKNTSKKGVAESRVIGWKHSTGDFVAIMDADDICYPDRLEKQLNAILKNDNINLCVGSANVIDDVGKDLGLTIKSTNNLKYLYWNCAIVHPTALIRKKYFDDNNIIYNVNLEYGEDLDLWLQFLSSPSPTFVSLNDNLIQYRAVKENRLSDKSIEDSKKYSNTIRSIYKSHNIGPILSVISNDDDVLYSQSIYNIEIVDDIQNAKGKYIAFSSMKNNRDRFLNQLKFLESNKDYSGVGTFIQQKDGKFFYTSDYKLIEYELSKGRLAFEPSSLMFRNVGNVINIEKDLDYNFKLACSLLRYGKLSNIDYCGVITDDTYKNKDVIESYPKRYITFNKFYKSVINVIQLNVTGDGNFSGVDRYLTTLENNLPPNIRMTRITFVLSNKILVDSSDKNHIKVYYNDVTRLESLYDLLWDNCKNLFENRENLIVQSNCLNLYTLQTYIRSKVYCKLICAVHCVPYREVIRDSRDKYESLELLFEDWSKEFIDKPSHVEPLKVVDKVLLNTDDAENWYLRCGYDYSKYVKVYNGIQSFERKAELKENYDENEFRFLFVGHHSQLKGMDQIIEIVGELIKERPDLKFKVIWAGATSKKLTDKILENNLPIRPLGVMPPKDIELLYSLVDATIIASACETCSYAAIESLSASLPIIATKVHGVEEVVKNAGLLVSVDKKGIIDKEEYKKAMIAVMTNYDLRKGLATMASKKFDTYDVNKMIEKLSEVYLGLFT